MASETETTELIKSSLEAIRTGKSHPSKEQKVLRKIRKIKNPKKDELRIIASQWIITYHMANFSTSENSKQVDFLMKTVESDLRHVLNLLEKKFENIDHDNVALVLTADVAQKLSDFDRLETVYEKLKLMTDSVQMSFMTMTIAPSLADWKLFYKTANFVGKEIKKSMPNNMSDSKESLIECLHKFAENGMPDLGVIYSYVDEYKLYDLNTKKRNKLQSSVIKIEKADIEIQKVHCESSEREKEIREQFEKDKEEEFTLEDLTISLNGGILMIPGLSSDIPQLLYGPYFDPDHIVAEGFTDVQLQESGTNIEDTMPLLNQEIMENMPPELIEAINSGEMNPETLMNMLSEIGAEGPAVGGDVDEQAVSGERKNDPKSKSSILRQSIEEFSKYFKERGPEMFKKHGIDFVRQQERLDLKKTPEGYEGSYIVRNYSPFDKSDETSIVLSIKFQCDHLDSPPHDVNDNFEEISAGIDNLKLD